LATISIKLFLNKLFDLKDDNNVCLFFVNLVEWGVFFEFIIRIRDFHLF